MTALTTDVSRAQAHPELVGRPSYQWAVATAIVLLFAYGRMLCEFAIHQWSRPQYQYFPFVLGAFGWLLWRNGVNAEPQTARPRYLRQVSFVTLMGLAWVLLAIAYYSNSPWLAVVSAILLLGSLFIKVSSQLHVMYLWGIWALLWLIVPLPLHRDQQLVTGLQQLSSRLSSTFLDAAAVEHLMDGNTLLLPDRQLFVDEACSGIISVMSIITCSVIYGLWRNRPPAHVILLAMAGVGWATFMNVIRITVIALALDKAGVDWSSGASHEILSLIVFTLVFFALLSTDLLLLGLLAPIGPTWEETAGAPPRLGRRIVQLWDRVFAALPPVVPQEANATKPVTGSQLLCNLMELRLVPLSAFALLALLQFSPMPTVHKSAATSSEATDQYVQRALACTADALPAKIDTLQRVNFEVQKRERNDLLAENSRMYEYRDDHGSEYAISCDFPYGEGWHELTICYCGLGWDLIGRRVVGGKSQADSSDWPYMEAEFSKPDGSKGFLLVSAFDDSGQHIDLPSYSFLEDVWNSLGGRKPVRQTSFQVQVWTKSPRPIDSREREVAKQLLLLARQKFHDLIALPGNLEAKGDHTGEH